MGNWRARPKLPVEMENAIRKESLNAELKLKDYVESLLDAGLEVVKKNSTEHVFAYPDVFMKYGKARVCEFIVDEKYSDLMDVVQQIVPKGAGKKGKILTECIVVGRIIKGLEDPV